MSLPSLKRPAARSLGLIVLGSLSTGLLGSACNELACPANAPYALDITIENGAADGECLYSVLATFEDKSFRVECSPADDACLCYGGEMPGTYRVTVSGQLVVDTQTVTVAENDCGVLTETVTFERPAVSELMQPGCQEARDHFAACGMPWPFENNCVDVSLPAREQSYIEGISCSFACMSEPSCAALEDSLCAPATEVTTLERCVADCLDGDTGGLDEIGVLNELVDYCEKLGAGGSRGP